jgi:hypothetical protein
MDLLQSEEFLKERLFCGKTYKKRNEAFFVYRGGVVTKLLLCDGAN